MKKKSFPELKNYKLPDKFGTLLGYEVVSASRTHHRAVTGLKLREDHLSPAGRVHGGVVAAFVDFSCGAAVFTTLGSGDFCSTVELKVNYFKPLMTGDVLRAESQVMFRGKRLCVVHCLVKRKGEKAPVAMATGTFNIISA
jgi:uncharacterized protein (TIGR00369 family)